MLEKKFYRNGEMLYFILTHILFNNSIKHYKGQKCYFLKALVQFIILPKISPCLYNPGENIWKGENAVTSNSPNYSSANNVYIKFSIPNNKI